jgi:SAM-dependent methyltransferase
LRGDFTGQAEAYARARPGYPERLVDELVADAGVRPGDPVVDLGAGTGLFTAMLAARGLAVAAVEPAAAMRARAPQLPGATWRDGTFESTGLAPASKRWAVAAQAFHWADPPRALPEAHRILLRGGSLTVLWNDRDVARSELLARTRALVEELVPGFDEGYRARDWDAVLVSTGHFAPPRRHEARHVVAMTPARYLDLWRSHHLLAEAAGAAGVARLLERVAALLLPEGIVEVPYVCRAWTASRLG